MIDKTPYYVHFARYIARATNTDDRISRRMQAIRQMSVKEYNKMKEYERGIVENGSTTNTEV